MINFNKEKFLTKLECVTQRTSRVTQSCYFNSWALYSKMSKHKIEISPNQLNNASIKNEYRIWPNKIM